MELWDLLKIKEVRYDDRSVVANFVDSQAGSIGYE